jgi:hypothetical protein
VAVLLVHGVGLAFASVIVQRRLVLTLPCQHSLWQYVSYDFTSGLESQLDDVAGGPGGVR